MRFCGGGPSPRPLSPRRAGRGRSGPRLKQRGDDLPRCLWWLTSSRSSAINLEQTGAALPAADAHGHHAPLGFAPTALLQNVAGEPRAGHAEGMADRNRAAVDVVLVGIDAELIARIETLAGKGLIELPQIDVVDLHAG